LDTLDLDEATRALYLHEKTQRVFGLAARACVE
jgi:hypothetical protein